MLDFHNKNKGLGTMASKIVEDPSRYGVLILDEKTNKISSFLEKNEYKPHPEKMVPMPINAGLYLLEPEVFSYIEPNIKFSIEMDVFPKLAKEEKLYYYPIPGIWKDIGKPEELLEGNILLMTELLKNTKDKKENLIDESANIDEKVLIHPPVTIGENVIIKGNSVVGPNVVIGDNVYIENAEIKESLIFGNAYISKNVKVEKSIISDNCYIQDGAVIKGKDDALVILADHVVVLENINIITDNTPISVCHHEVVKENKISSDYIIS